jgi:lysyl-tRNA synthetase class 2
MTEAERLAGRLRNLERRAALNRAIRRFFDERDFLEIEAPILVPSPGLELHLDAFEIAGEAGPF